jgi:hypothetical protein
MTKLSIQVENPNDYPELDNATGKIITIGDYVLVLAIGY